jgi:hypothetical protein
VSKCGLRVLFRGCSNYDPESVRRSQFHGRLLEDFKGDTVSASVPGLGLGLGIVDADASEDKQSGEDG